MGRQTNKQKADKLLAKLSKKEIAELLEKYNASTDYEEVEKKFIVQCPHCECSGYIKKGKTKYGLTIYKCKDCGKKFTIFTGTIMEKTPYSWKVWVSILEQMLRNQSIKTTREYLIKNKLVPEIDRLTVSAIENKIRASFAHMPLPTLTGKIQVDEKHFKESQKGFKDPIDPFDSSKRRKAHKRSTPTEYGTMGPEMATICCAVDETNHAIAKVVTMGKMELETFEDEITTHFKDITFLCSDMNTLYTQWASLHKVPQYVCNSQYHRVMKKCDTKKKKVSAYEQDKLDYVVGAGIMNYDKMVKFRETNKLTINGVNSYHSELERYINHIAKGVSTNHLQAWVSFFNYRWNWRTDHYDNPPRSYQNAEEILVQVLKAKHHVKIEDIKTHKDKTKKQSKRYSNKLIAKTVAARIKSNNPYIKFEEEDGVWLVDKKKSVSLLPEYKRRELAKGLGIKPFSPIAVSSKDLIKKLLAHPDLEEHLYILANGTTEDSFKQN